jgi:hypothetical protein
MRFSFVRLRVVLPLVAGILSLHVTAARAQTSTTIATTQVPTRVAGPQDPVFVPKAISTNPIIATKNCTNDESFEFALTTSTMEQRGELSLRVFAGADDAKCDELANRQGSTARCWEVRQTEPLPSEVGFRKPVRIQDMLSKIDRKDPSAVDYSKAGAQACETNTNRILRVWFLVVKSESVLANISQAFAVRMLGPAAPSLDSVRGGDGALVLSFTPPSGSTSTTTTTEAGTTTSGGTTNIASYNVYCSPQPGGAGAALAPEAGADSDPSVCAANESAFDQAPPQGDASVASTSGALILAEDAGQEDAADASIDVAATDADAGDSSADATADATPPDGGTPVTEPTTSNTSVDPGWLCKDKPSIPAGTSTSSRITGFANGYAYNVAIAAVDNAGNVSPRSKVRCGVPNPVDGFWDSYRGAGGAAGGGYCSVYGVGMPFGAGATALVVLSAAIGFFRRRKDS